MTTNNLNIKKRLEDLKLDINRLSSKRHLSKAEMCIQLLSAEYRDIPKEIKELIPVFKKDIESLMYKCFTIYKITDVVSILVEKHKDSPVEAIVNLIEQFDKDLINRKKITHLILNLLNDNSELSFDHKISSQELKKKILNDTEINQYNLKEIEEEVDYYINMLISLKKLKKNDKNNHY